MLATHLDAENRYSAIRKVALESAARQIPNNPGIELTVITENALLAAKKWAGEKERRVDWNWLSGYSSFRFSNPKRFELAIWQKSKLLTLALGRPTYHGGGLRLDFVEANPDPDRIAVLPIVLLALIVYAQAIGATEIRIMNPINEKVRQYYESFDMVYVKKGDYLVRKV